MGGTHCQEYAVYLLNLYLEVNFDRILWQLEYFIFVEVACDGFTVYARNSCNKDTRIEENDIQNLLSTFWPFCNDWTLPEFYSAICLVFFFFFFLFYASLGIKNNTSEQLRNCIGITFFFFFFFFFFYFVLQVFSTLQAIRLFVGC